MEATAQDLYPNFDLYSSQKFVFFLNSKLPGVQPVVSNIKKFRLITKCGLKVAKDFIDTFYHNRVDEVTALLVREMVRTVMEHSTPREYEVAVCDVIHIFFNQIDGPFYVNPLADEYGVAVIQNVTFEDHIKDTITKIKQAYWVDPDASPVYNSTSPTMAESYAKQKRTAVVRAINALELMIKEYPDPLWNIVETRQRVYRVSPDK